MTVAFSRAALRAFVAASTDPFASHGLDQLLQPPLGQMADQITPLANIDDSAQLGRGRLGQSLTVPPPKKKTHHSTGLLRQARLDVFVFVVNWRLWLTS